MSENVYDGLREYISEARANTAKFRRVDLHVHTIDSHDYPSTHDKEGFVPEVPEDERGLKSKPDEFKQQFFEHVKNQNLSLVSVTDHSESGMAEVLSNLSDRDLTILPGMEIHVQTNLFPDSEVHLLGIFPEGTSSKTIDQVFADDSDFPESGERKGAATTLDIDTVIKRIKEDMGGVCIAAHVGHGKDDVRTYVLHQNAEWLQKNYLRRFLKEKDESGDLSEEDKQYLREMDQEIKPLDNTTQEKYLKFLVDHDFNAVQITDPEHRDHYSSRHMKPLGLRPFPCILSSDAHTIADVGCWGHCTYIKMTRVGIEDLKKAFLDPGTRIRYDHTVPEGRPKRLLGIEFEGGSFDGQVIGFSDNLTALIGGRGSGKSALIEAIRWIFQQPIDELPQRLQNDISSRRSFTLRDTVVKLLFIDENDKLYVLKRRLGDNETKCFTLEGTLLPEINLPDSQIFRIDVYGWSEIEELSDSPRKQLKILDNTIMGIGGLEQKVINKIEDIRQNGERIVSLAREIKNLLPNIKNADEVKQQLADLQTQELNEAFSDFDRNSKALQAMRNFEDITESAEAWLLSKKSESFFNKSAQENKSQEEGEPNYHAPPFEFSQQLLMSLRNNEDEIEDYPWFDDFSLEIRNKAESLQKTYNRFLRLITETEKQTDPLIEELENEKSRIETQLNELAEESGQSDFNTTLARRQQLSEEVAEISQFEEDIEKKQTAIREFLTKRYDELIPDLYQARDAVYKARKEKAEELEDKLSKLKVASGINIDIERLGDYKDYSRKLGYKEAGQYGGLFQGIEGQYISDDYPGFYSKKFLPHKFVNLLLSELNDYSALEIRYVREKGASKQINHLITEEVKEEEGSIIERDENGDVVYKVPTEDFELVEMLDPKRIWRHLSPLYYDGETKQYFDEVRLEKLFDLEASDIEDSPKILLDGKQIEGLSPGQRCSALIPIILVEGDNPIVIDQPEDNLDNKRVFELVVDIVRGLKEQRQIIVATHNPNIPVSGDAEQVIALKTPTKDVCSVEEQGSIDGEKIIDQVKAIMEGGDEAFKIRMKKYGLFRSQLY